MNDAFPILIGTLLGVLIAASPIVTRMADRFIQTAKTASLEYSSKKHKA